MPKKALDNKLTDRLSLAFISKTSKKKDLPSVKAILTKLRRGTVDYTNVRDVQAIAKARELGYIDEHNNIIGGEQ